MSSRAQAARGAHGATARRSATRSPSIPRRVSGPARPAARPAAQAAAAVAAPPVAAVPGVAIPAGRSARTRRPPSAFARVAALPDHRVIDRLLRGRLWIWLIGLSLGGVVGMQVSLLKLNTGISRAVQASATLERQNSSLEAGVARLSSGERISKAAASLGMSAPQAGDVEHLTVRRSDGRRAARRMSPPSQSARQVVAGVASGAAAAETTTAAPGGAPAETLANGAAPAVAPGAAAAPGTAAAAAGVHSTAAVAAPAPAVSTAPAPAATAPQG